MSRKTIKVKYGVEMNEPRRLPPWLKMLIVIGGIVGSIYVMYSFVVWVLAPTEEEIAIMNATPTEVLTATPTVEEITPTPTVRPSPTVYTDMLYELSSAIETNGDHVAGWITIPGLGVDTAVMQGSNNEYFQTHNIDLNGTEDGSVYFDYRSDFSYILDAGNIVIYGYNNDGGRQLKSMSKYASESYFEKYSLIVMYTQYGEYNFRIFSVHIEDDEEAYVSPVESDERSDFIDMCIEATMYAPEDYPDEDDTILTVSIDVESESGSRLLIHAFLEDY